MEPRHIYAALRRLQSNGELELTLDTTANGRVMHLKMNQEGIRLFRTRRRYSATCQVQKKNDISDELGAIVSKLSTQFLAKEQVSVGKVESMYDILHQVSCASTDMKDDEESDEEDGDGNTSCKVKKSPRLVVFQKLVQNYFSHLPPTNYRDSNNAPVTVKDFPLQNARLLSCLSSDTSLLMQMFALRPQEQMPLAVRVKDPVYADYRDLCLAKILHSIDAPRAPILQWYNHVLWGKYRSYTFSSVVQAVKRSYENS
eukprot:CAMPEP_0181104334 /NCGR_PEP_ID=MMETSP1071-20121207/15368_1 /TAXON_ID=35127 /ORGANISM="Thalassiosira sp., Strain NH16" /LENGTH=256 /DNA_ID=CAMNT_0023187517 /DNA_START=1125 /DNA_END=1895 /DNA_ORIENTATION=-